MLHLLVHLELSLLQTIIQGVYCLFILFNTLLMANLDRISKCQKNEVSRLHYVDFLFDLRNNFFKLLDAF